MKNSIRHSRLRRGVTFIALAAFLGLTAVGLSQCTLSKSVTGLDVKVDENYKSGDCKDLCNDAYKDAKRYEDDRYEAAKKACGRDKDCKKKQEEIHKDNEDKIKGQKKACKNGCYNEGGGHGGDHDD